MIKNRSHWHISAHNCDLVYVKVKSLDQGTIYDHDKNNHVSAIFSTLATLLTFSFLNRLVFHSSLYVETILQMHRLLKNILLHCQHLIFA